MILTGPEIKKEVENGRITIDPYDPDRIEPNSYGFSLGSTLMYYTDPVLDAAEKPEATRVVIGESGLCLHPGVLYLGSTLERMGSPHYAATLYARRSVSTFGMWIQHSAPLGHTGAIIPWTLEIRVIHPVIIYAGMLIGKIAFWLPYGEPIPYFGKYTGSKDVVASRLSQELDAQTFKRTPAE